MSQKRPDTRDRIVKAAASLFSTHGSTNTTLDDILSAAGVTKGAFYHHFKSKEILCETILDDVSGQLSALSEMADSADAVESLKEHFYTLASLHDSGDWVWRKLIITMTGEYARLGTTLRQRIKDFWQGERSFYIQMLDRAKQQEIIGVEVDTEAAADMIVSIIAGALTVEKSVEQKLAFAEQAWTFVQTLRR